jgi:hypothetical protein
VHKNIGLDWSLFQISGVVRLRAKFENLHLLITASPKIGLEDPDKNWKIVAESSRKPCSKSIMLSNDELEWLLVIGMESNERRNEFDNS